MNKQAIVRKIIAKLTGELEVYFRAAEYARAEATHEQNKAENKYDTRGLEASYLARGQSRQAAELESAIAEYEKLDVKKFSSRDGIDIGALVELEQRGEKFLYFIGPRAGGTEIEHGRGEIMVITPQSPLGGELLKKKSGMTVTLRLGAESHPAKIVAVE